MDPREKAVEAARAAILDIDTEIEARQEQIRGLRAEKRELERTVGVLTGVRKTRRRTGDRSIAGPAAIAKVEAVLVKHGTAYQSDIAKATGLNSGTITHALRALAQDGKVRATENVRNRSREFAYVGAKPKARRRVKVAA